MSRDTAYFIFFGVLGVVATIIAYVAIWTYPDTDLTEKLMTSLAPLGAWLFAGIMFWLCDDE